MLQGSRLNFWQRLTPSQMFVLSFLLLILLGAAGFLGLPGLYTGQPLSWLDALFTSTSAVCVTGLSVIDVSSRLTFRGQAYLLVLIQLGGLGMLTLASMILASLGGRLSLRAESITVNSVQNGAYASARRMVVDVVRFTIVIEAFGALLLYAFWLPEMGHQAALWSGVFHSISAFCNAGFSTFSDSLIQHRESPTVSLTITTLIVLGGIGFLTMEELYQYWFRRSRKKLQHRRPVSIHTKLVILTSATLTLVGWVFFAVLEWDNTLGALSISDKLHNSLFMSVTPRTAGFNMIDYTQATDSTNFLTILLMMIGGSPGSTAGGMKTTTFALLGLIAWSRLRGHRTTAFVNRSIPDETLQRAVGLFVLATGVVVFGVLLLTTTESSATALAPFLAYAFEVVSAFNTVGLSMNLTTEISPLGRWLLILLMFLGRVGPLALVAAFIVRRSVNSKIRYAYEDVIVG